MDFTRLLENLVAPVNRPQYAFYHDQGVIPTELNKIYDRIVPQPNPQYPHVNAEEMIKPYYGDFYQREVEKANQYTSEQFPHKIRELPRTWWQTLLNQPAKTFVSAQRENVPSAYFSLRENTEQNRKKNVPINPVDDYFDQANHGTHIDMQWPDKRSPITADMGPLQKDSKKQFMSVLEHEAGHNTGSGFHLSPYFNNQTHLSKPVELENGLGRINRENFLMSGTRFDSNSLEDYMKAQLKLSSEDRFKGFSNEALRVWDVLRQSYESTNNDERQLFKDAQVIIPAFVKNENQTAKAIFG